MKNMKKKFLIIFFTLNLISLVSCWEHCKDYEFYDYSGINIVVQNPNVIENDSLSFGLLYLGGEYLSKSKTTLNFGSNLYAQIDCDKGYGGDKYPVTRISIKSDSNFNSDYLANSELNEIVSIRGNNSNGEYVLGKVNDFVPSQVNLGYMWISDKPTLDSNHKITVEIEKSNGEVLSATSEQIVWE